MLKILKSISIFFIIISILSGMLLAEIPEVIAESEEFEDYLSVAAIAKNEGPYLQEWIEYHKLVGVQRFYIYDNESYDNTQQVLEPYIEDGTVVYKFLPGKDKQGSAYMDALESCKNRTYWCAFIDLNEFIVPSGGKNIAQWLHEEYEDYSGVCISWLVYGSSGHIDVPDGLVMENFKRHVNKNAEPVKSIVKPRLVTGTNGDGWVNTHTFTYKEGFAVNQAKKPLTKTGLICDEHNIYTPMRINHYHLRSLETFLERNNKGDSNSYIPPYTLVYTLTWYDSLNINDIYEEPDPETIQQLKQALQSKKRSSPVPTSASQKFQLPDPDVMEDSVKKWLKFWLLDAMNSKEWDWLVENKFKILESSVKRKYINLLRSITVDDLKKSVWDGPLPCWKYRIITDRKKIDAYIAQLEATIESKKEPNAIGEKLPTVKILTAYHRPAKLLTDENVFVPIHVGRAISIGSDMSSEAGGFVPNEESDKWMREHMIGDDTGDNISDRNRQYCEMTAVYWAWKNQDQLGNPDYIGLQHYRNHFDFTNEGQLNNYIKITPKYQDLFGLREETIRSKCANYDLIVPCMNYTPILVDLWECAKKYLRDYGHEDILNELDSQFKNYFTITFIKNIFILNRHLFNEYCEFIFPILESFSKDNPNPRRVGYLSELLTSAFLGDCMHRRGLNGRIVGGNFYIANPFERPPVETREIIELKKKLKASLRSLSAKITKTAA